MKILIFGGTGFVGKHLCEHLSERDITTRVISRNPDVEFLKNYAPAIDAYSLDDGQAHMPQLLAEASTLVYLASTSTPATDHHSLNLEVENNVVPACRVFDLALEVNPHVHIIYISSGGTVYGHKHTSPISENSPTQPESLYAFGKVIIENYLAFLSKCNPDYSYTVLRASNPVGKWSKNKAQGFINVALSKVLKELPVVLYGDGLVTRDYISADDLAEAILMSAENRPQSNCKIWNVGSGVGYNLNDILSKIGSVTGVDVKIERKEARNIDLLYNVLDSSCIKRELLWEAKTGIEELIRRTWSEINN